METRKELQKCCRVRLIANILKIDTVVPYSGSYDDVVNQGQNEVQRGYEPEIKPLDINIADYDVIAVGTPKMEYSL